MERCVFCTIISKNDPHHEIWWQNDAYVAFLDLHPNKRGHTLVIPKIHTDEVFSMEQDSYTALMLAVKTVGNEMQFFFNMKRIGMVVEGMSVGHIHVHLIPIQKSGDLEAFSEYVLADGELEQLGEELRKSVSEDITR